MAYYYLVAQLPCLIYEQKPPMSSTAFKDMAKSLMEEKDSELFDNLSIGDEKQTSTGCDFIDNWQDWEHTLRLNLAKQRAIKIKRDLPSESPVYSVEPAAAASKAIDEYSPLEGEILLDKARWRAINSLVGSVYFHRNNIYAYYLKLILLERRQAFNADIGFTEYKSLYASILEDFESVQNAEELRSNSELQSNSKPLEVQQ